MSWDEIGDRIYRRRFASLDLNIGLVLCDGAAVVVDSRANHREADELRAEIRALTSLPVTHVIDTHWHWDHCFGNARFPDATIIGHLNCRRALVDRGQKMKADLIASDWVSEVARPLFEEVVITPPRATFETEHTLQVGGRDIDLRYLGLAHTDADIVVLVDGVCFAGDLVEESGPPYFGDGYPEAWVDTLGALLPLLEGPVVPGHGDAVDELFVATQRDEIAAAVRAVRAGNPGSGPYPAAVMEQIADRLEW